MRHDFQARMPEVANKIKFFGDVRNKSTLKYAMKGVDYVFHAAALKQVPSCEFFPYEADTPMPIDKVKRITRRKYRIYLNNGDKFTVSVR